MNALVRDEVLRADANKGFIIDGYPATLAEADYLGKLVKEAKLPAPIIIQLDVPDAEVRRRMQAKGDTTDLEKRLAVHQQRLNADHSDGQPSYRACSCGQPAGYAGRREKTFQSALGPLQLSTRQS
jgi:adenylate kinase family enzyme